MLGEISNIFLEKSRPFWRFPQILEHFGHTKSDIFLIYFAVLQYKDLITTLSGIRYWYFTDKWLNDLTTLYSVHTVSLQLVHK